MIYESGRESIYIDDIEQGFETYEGRLDHRLHGESVDGEPRQLRV